MHQFLCVLRKAIWELLADSNVPAAGCFFRFCAKVSVSCEADCRGAQDDQPYLSTNATSRAELVADVGLLAPPMLIGAGCQLGRPSTHWVVLPLSPTFTTEPLAFGGCGPTSPPPLSPMLTIEGRYSWAVHAGLARRVSAADGYC